MKTDVFAPSPTPNVLFPPNHRHHRHHRRDGQRRPPHQEALTAFAEFCSGDVVLIAHNNDAFDKLFLEAEFQRAGLQMPEWIFIDSLKWSRKYRTDLPRHSLQFLREVYGIEANQAHRALDDVHCSSPSI